MKQKLELRSNNFQLTKTDEGLKVSGYVNKTNQWSETLGVRKKFVERILPGTFTRALQAGNEIHFYAEHDSSKILASTRNGSLSLREDEAGLYMEAEIAPTSWGQDYHTLIKTGIIRNMSFGMKVLKDSWKKLEDGLYERSISDIFLAEVSAVRNPAYAQSTIAARSIEVVEDVEVPEVIEKQEEKRELTFEEQLEVKRSHLKGYEKLALLDEDDVDLKSKINILKGEIRNMESQLNTQTATLEKQEELRVIKTDSNPGASTIPIHLVREKAKKMNGKHSLVARTKIVVQKDGYLDTLLEDAENYKQNLFVGQMENLKMSDFTAQKVRITPARIGHAIEVSELLLEKSVLEEQEASYEKKLRGRIEDSTNYCMLTDEGNMENLNADSSVSSIISTAGIDTISLIDAFELESELNQEYREGASFIVHSEVAKKIRTNPEFKDHVEFAIDEVTGKKMYHLIGYPMVVNDNADTKRIIFGNLYEGYKTVISEGLKKIPQDIYGNQINKEIRSFDLYKSTDSERQMNAKPVYQMDAYIGGKVINKDCFVRLDVTQATQASDPVQTEEVENPTEQVASVTAESVVAPEVKPESKVKKQSKPKA